MHANHQYLKAIAQGTSFDTTQAIRQIAIYIATTIPDAPPPLFPTNVRLTAILRKAGIITPDDLALATDDDLLAIPGITPKDITRIRQGK